MGNKSASIEATKRTGIPDELADPLVFSGGYQHQRNRRASKARAAWKETGSDRLMTFLEFRQQGTRNKRRGEFGLEPIFLPWESKPGEKRRRR